MSSGVVVHIDVIKLTRYAIERGSGSAEEKVKPLQDSLTPTSRWNSIHSINRVVVSDTAWALPLVVNDAEAHRQAVNLCCFGAPSFLLLTFSFSAGLVLSSFVS